MRLALVLLLLLALVLPAAAADPRSHLFAGRTIEKLDDAEVCAEAIFRLLGQEVAEGKVERVRRLRKIADAPTVTKGSVDKDKALARHILASLQAAERGRTLHDSGQRSTLRDTGLPELSRQRAGIVEGALDSMVDGKIEAFLGKMLKEQLLGAHASAPEAEVAYWRKVAEPIFAHAKKDRAYGAYELFVFDWKENGHSVVNAVAIPGGYMALTTGIVALMERDRDALAFAIGHEAGHHADKDAIKKIRVLLVTFPGRIVAGKFLQRYLDMPLSRRDEYQADRLGLTYAKKAGYDPNGAIRCLSRLAEWSNEPPEPDPNSTHPSSRDRIAKLKPLIAAKKR